MKNSWKKQKPNCRIRYAGKRLKKLTATPQANHSSLNKLQLTAIHQMRHTLAVDISIEALGL